MKLTVEFRDGKGMAVSNSDKEPETITEFDNMMGLLRDVTYPEEYERKLKSINAMFAEAREHEE